MLRQLYLRAWALLALLLLAACGGASGSAPTAAPALQATPAPAATQPATAPAAPTAPPQPTVGSAPTAGQAGIPEGTTSEGYHVLGRADAPVTLVMYSDFL